MDDRVAFGGELFRREIVSIFVFAENEDRISRGNIGNIRYVDHHKVHAYSTDHRDFLSTHDHMAFATVVSMEPVEVANR